MIPLDLIKNQGVNKYLIKPEDLNILKQTH